MLELLHTHGRIIAPDALREELAQVVNRLSRIAALR